MDSVATLNRSLARVGTRLTIERNVSGGSPLTTSALAFVRGYQPNELTDDIEQNDRKVILSPTGLAFVPQRLDRIVIQGVRCSVQAADAVEVSGAVVRIDCQVRG